MRSLGFIHQVAAAIPDSVDSVFDFSYATEDPVLSMAVWDFITDIPYDGADVQYASMDTNSNWAALGQYGDGNQNTSTTELLANWYTSNALVGLAGWNSAGWTNSSRAWKTVQHTL